jgi:hypothetical protein
MPRCAVLVACVTTLTLFSSPNVLAATPAASAPLANAPEGALAWHDWSPAVFEQARREQRLVLLDLGAVWCHWCHVMEQETYRDPQVVALLKAHFVAVQVDQDARPDLANRYEDYGWPATVIFAADGGELVKFRGYVPPARMAALLRAVVDDPTPGPSVSAVSEPESRPTTDGLPMSPALLRELDALLVERYDTVRGGWGVSQKFLDWDAVEYSLLRARRGDVQAGQRALETLTLQRRLIDPIWGGVYQYSDSGDWEHPHFEKIMSMQAENLRIYAHAYAQSGAIQHLRAAQDIARFLEGPLSSPEGLFYASQDADVVRGEQAATYFARDDAGRRRLGLPRIDRHIYARENAWAAQALLALHAVTGEARLLARARLVARFLLAERAQPEGGFRHDARDAAGPYLGDTLAAARLFLALYSASGEREWLNHAAAGLDFIARTFRVVGQPGFVTSSTLGFTRPTLAARPQRDENIALARLANLLFHYTGAPRFRQQAEHALRFLALPAVARRPQTAGVLLAAEEWAAEPLHVTVVGRADDDLAQALLLAARAEPRAFKRVELWDRRAGALPRADVSFPELTRSAAFVCSTGRCSAPAFTPEELRAQLARRVRE